MDQKTDKHQLSAEQHAGSRSLDLELLPGEQQQHQVDDDISVLERLHCFGIGAERVHADILQSILSVGSGIAGQMDMRSVSPQRFGSSEEGLRIVLQAVDLGE